MPRLAKTQAERQCAAILREVDAYVADRRRNGFDAQSAAQSLGLTYTVLWRRRKNPESFTLSELQSIANTLNISLPALLGEK